MNTRLEPLYQSVASKLADLIDQGVYATGDRVPSIRQMSANWGVSYNTVTAAYRLLQEMGKLESIPQSGYVVVNAAPVESEIPHIAHKENCHTISSEQITRQLWLESRDPKLIHLGEALPTLAVKSVGELLSKMARSANRKARWKEMPPNAKATTPVSLIQAVLKRMYAAGCPIDARRSYITKGLMEAVQLSLRAMVSSGARVGIDYPCDPGILLAISACGATPCPIPSDLRKGLTVAAVEQALGKQTLGCLITAPTYSNPTGALMPPKAKADLAEALGRRSVPIIEIDHFGDLDHAGVRHPYLKSFDRWDNVTLCTSFELTLCDEANQGFVFASRHHGPEVTWYSDLRIAHGNSFRDEALATFIAGGSYDRHLHLVRRIYARNSAMMVDLLERHMPTGTRVHAPLGGFFLWVELPAHVDAYCLSRVARAEGIVIAPGQMFMPAPGFSHHLRLSVAHWSATVRDAIVRLGHLAKTTKCLHGHKGRSPRTGRDAGAAR